MADPRPTQAPKDTAEIERLRADARALIEALDIEAASLPTRLRAAIEALGEEVIELRGDVAALENALEDARALADHDALCPVYNRRAFLRELEREIARAERHGNDLSLIYIDLDRFKQVNDRFGHEAGDSVLQKVCALILTGTRASDITGRLGGDEFAVILPHADATGAGARAEALSREIARFTVRSAKADFAPVRLGASCGAVAWHSGCDARTLISLADEAMFRAKAARASGAENSRAAE